MKRTIYIGLLLLGSLLAIHAEDAVRSGLHCGQEVRITATPDAGYHFVRWSDGNTSNPRTLDVADIAGITFTAIFQADDTSDSGTTGGDTGGSGTTGGGTTPGGPVTPGFPEPNHPTGSVIYQGAQTIRATCVADGVVEIRVTRAQELHLLQDGHLLEQWTQQPDEVHRLTLSPATTYTLRGRETLYLRL